MANKVNDLFSRFSRNPSGLNTGIKLLLAAGGLGYAATQSVFTGINYLIICLFNKSINQKKSLTPKWMADTELSYLAESEALKPTFIPKDCIFGIISDAMLL
jgi:hypothetical protein